MNTLSDVVKKAAKNQKVSEAKLAVTLGVSRQYLNSGKRTGDLSDPVCLSLAEFAGLTPESVLVLRNATRERGPAQAAWQNLYASISDPAILYYRNLWGKLRCEAASFLNFLISPVKFAHQI